MKELTNDDLDELVDGSVFGDWRGYAREVIAADRFLNAPVGRDVMREALETIVEMHNAFCEHHVGVQSHSHELADIAERALAAAPTPPVEQQGEQEPVAWTTGIEWPARMSEQVKKLTREKQAEHGFNIPLYTHPPNVLATLRAKVEALLLAGAGNLQVNKKVYLEDVLALIDKMGGKV